MRVESSISTNVRPPETFRNSKEVVAADDIKTILFLGIRSDLPVNRQERKVDIFA